MKKQIILLAALIFTVIVSGAQAQNAPRIYNYATSLASVPCDTTQNALWIIRSGGSAGVYRCSVSGSPGTFTLAVPSFLGGVVTSPITFPDGTAAAPSMAFTSDADGTGTGIFRSAANTIGFSTNGVERWVINASGALNPTVNNTYDIGNGTVNPRDLNLGRNIVFPDGVRQTFNPDATTPGFNPGSVAGDPSAPSNGDLWYDSVANELTARINGANVALGAGGGGASTGEQLLSTTTGFNVAATTWQDLYTVPSGTCAPTRTIVHSASTDLSDPGDAGNFELRESSTTSAISFSDSVPLANLSSASRYQVDTVGIGASLLVTSGNKVQGRAAAAHPFGPATITVMLFGVCY